MSHAIVRNLLEEFGFEPDVGHLLERGFKEIDSAGTTIEWLSQSSCGNFHGFGWLTDGRIVYRGQSGSLLVAPPEYQRPLTGGRSKIHNPNCEGDNCASETGDVRVVQFQFGTLRGCRSCYERFQQKEREDGIRNPVCFREWEELAVWDPETRRATYRLTQPVTIAVGKTGFGGEIIATSIQSPEWRPEWNKPHQVPMDALPDFYAYESGVFLLQDTPGSSDLIFCWGITDVRIEKSLVMVSGHTLDRNGREATAGLGIVRGKPGQVFNWVETGVMP